MADLLIFAQGGTWDARFQVSSLAATAAASGESVDLALFFGALAAWTGDGWDRLDPAPPVDPGHLATLGFPPLSEMLAGPRREGGLKVFACSASCRILDLDLARVQSRVDAILGWQSFAEMSARAGRVVSF